MSPTGPLLELIPAGTPLYRIHQAGLAPVFYRPAPGQPPAYRFDLAAPAARVCYVGVSAEAAFAETVVRTAVLPPGAVPGPGWHPPRRPQLVTRAWLATRRLATLRTRRPLRVAVLHGAGLARAGVSGEVVMGLDYARSQAVALGLWRDAARPEGIRYPCRHDSETTALALFDRVAPPDAGEAPAPAPAVPLADALEVLASEPLLADRRRLADWLQRYGLALG